MNENGFDHLFQFICWVIAYFCQHLAWNSSLNNIFFIYIFVYSLEIPSIDTHKLFKQSLANAFTKEVGGEGLGAHSNRGTWEFKWTSTLIFSLNPLSDNYFARSPKAVASLRMEKKKKREENRKQRERKHSGTFLEPKPPPVVF